MILSKNQITDQNKLGLDILQDSFDFLSESLTKKKYNVDEIISKIRKKSVFVKINYIVKENIKLKAFLNATIIKDDNLSLFAALIKNLIFPGKVWINIHYQALKLFLKKIKIEKKPLENKIKNTFAEKS